MWFQLDVCWSKRKAQCKKHGTKCIWKYMMCVYFLANYLESVIYFISYLGVCVVLYWKGRLISLAWMSVDVPTSWCSAVSLGSDYGAWCRVTVCRLSCTATLILSINNNPPHCRPEPHLLITICHLSDAPPSPSPFRIPSLSLFVFSSSLPPNRASYPLHRSTSASSHPLHQLHSPSTQRHGPAYRGMFSHSPLTLIALWIECD